jgi:hypothetical protein
MVLLLYPVREFARAQTPDWLTAIYFPVSASDQLPGVVRNR